LEDELVSGLAQDLRYALRQLRKSPGFTTVAVLTLALGIGTNTAMFSVIDGVLLRPLPFKSPGGLYTLWERNMKMGYEQNPPAAANFRDWRDRNRVFEQLAAFDSAIKINLAGGGNPERVDGAAVSPGLFELLGITPILGRTFSSNEDQLGHERVILLGYGLWQRRFNADRSVVGEQVTVDDKNFTVVGVMPPGFQFPGDTGTVLNIYTAPAAQVWIPLALTAQQWNQRSSHYLQVIGRLKTGIRPDVAQAQMSSIERELSRDYPREYIGTDIKLVSLHAQVVSSIRAALLVLFGAVVFVLLIACANIANLLLARATVRRREVAIRSALGATRARLVRQLVTESLTLAMVGGALGILLAFWATHLAGRLLPSDFPRASDIDLNSTALLFTAVVSISTGFVFGLAPALRSVKGRITESLKQGERGAGGSPHSRLRNALVVCQIALALILLVGTGLLLRSFSRLRAVDLGFQPNHILTMEISLPDARYPDPQKAAFFAQLLDRIRSLPGVQSAGAIGHLPLGGDIESYAMQVEGRAPLPNEFANPDCHVVMPGYLEAMEVPLVEGRFPDERDNLQSPHVVVINDVVARNVFPNENPIGKRLRMGFNGFSGEIIGVVRHTSHLSLDSAPVEEIYTPYLQAPFWNQLTLTVRTASAPLALAQPIQELVRSMDHDEPVAKIRTMGAVTQASVAEPRFRALLLGSFAFTALLLGAIGLYGVMSYVVTQRTREVGLRIALGATRSQVIALVLRDGLRLVLTGLAIGIVAALALVHLLTSMLYEVQPTDPLAFVAMSVFLGAIALLATCLPARRAAKVDPIVALRCE
jgi:putative ABC transport system permease protein